MTVSQSWTLRVESVAALQRRRDSGENTDNQECVGVQFCSVGASVAKP